MTLETELLKHFGFTEFRPGQKALIEAVLAGQDALGVMPTGGGKSLTFQLPVALTSGTVLVVSPLIALMKDQVDSLNARGIRAAAYNSALSSDESWAVREDVLSGRVRVLYMSPERVQKSEFMGFLSQVKFSYIAIDEAHCISHWGHDFRPDYRKLNELRRFIRGTDPQKNVPIIALTATATTRVQEDIIERLELKNPVSVITGFRRDNLSFEVKKCANRKDKLSVMKNRLTEALSQGGSAIVYAATRKTVERVALELTEVLGGSQVSFYHAGLTDSSRSQTQEDFLSGKKPVLVATNAFGMGIDKKDVRAVIHYDIPGSVEAYYQEAGRAGRDGLPSKATVLFNYADVATQEYLIERSTNSETQRALLKQMTRYAYASECRQHLILEYFGDVEARTFKGCGQCDNCKPAESRELIEPDEMTAMITRETLAAVSRINGRFGKGRLVELLKGADKSTFLNTGLQHEEPYGLLSEWTVESIRELVDVLIDSGCLKISGLEYPLISITPQGLRVLKGEAPVALARELGS